ncbi:hypothetical protein LINPERHAP1_LOCUS29638 [Linum perenne]
MCFCYVTVKSPFHTFTRRGTMWQVIWLTLGMASL